MALAAGMSPLAATAQVNAEQVLLIGRNVLSMQDYMLAIQYFNAAIAAKPYLSDPYYYRALAKLQLDDLRGAEEDCTLALERNKFKVEAYKLRGFARQNMGLDSLAVADYDEGLSHNPTDRYFLFYKGLAETSLGRLRDARATLETLTRRYPKWGDGVAARARLETAAGDTLAALRDLDRAIGLNRTSANARLQRAELLAARKQWHEALEDMDEAVRLHPDEADMYINRAYLRYNDENFDGAMDDYNTALRLEPDSRAALFNRALMRLELHDYINAEKDFTAVLDMDPRNFHARYNRGIALLEMERYQEALTDFRAIAQRYARFYPVYYAMAECERNMGRMQQAVANINRADDLVRLYVADPTGHDLDRPTIAPGRSNSGSPDDPDDDDMMEMFNRLVTVSSESRTDMAFNDRIRGRVQDRDAAAEPEPALAVTFLPPAQRLGTGSDRCREVDEYNSRSPLAGHTLYLTPGPGAVSDAAGFDDVSAVIASLTPSADHASAPAVKRLTRGVAYAMIRNYPAALADLDAAIERQPDYTLAYLARASVRCLQASAETAGAEAMPLHNAGRLLAGAAADCDRALELNPRLWGAWFNKGCALYAAGDYTAAAQAFTKALEQRPDIGQAYFNRALCRLRSGERTEAVADLSKAGELGVIASYNILKRLG